jgi:ankyrin repeat protein
MLSKGSKLGKWLNYHGFKHINYTQLVIVPAGYDYGDVELIYHTFPLHTAISERNPDLDLIKSLLDEGADPNFQTRKTLGPVLHTVLVNNNWWNDNTIKLLTLLIKYGADVNSRDS